MNKITIQDLPAKTYFSDSVFLDRRYILTSSDVPLTAQVRDRLLDWGFTYVYSEGERSSNTADTAGGSAEASQANVFHTLEDEQEQLEAERFFTKTAAAVEAAFDRFRAHDEIRLTESSELVKAIMSELKRNRRFLLGVPGTHTQSMSFLATHSVKTTFVALSIADYVKMPSFKQIDVGLSAMYHQIGMLRLPDELYLSDRNLLEQERKTLTAHPVIGFKVLRAVGFPANACLAVLEHNERVNGSGAPRGITGDQMSDFGKVLAVASSYCAATSSRPYRSSYDGHAGIMDLLKDAGKRYDESALAALVCIVSIYPVGTHVLMSNGSIGVVVRANADDPRFPAVRLLLDEQYKPYRERPVVQTRAGDTVSIKQSLGPEDIAKLRKGG